MYLTTYLQQGSQGRTNRRTALGRRVINQCGHKGNEKQLAPLGQDFDRHLVG
jgi:hypothetical protein